MAGSKYQLLMQAKLDGSKSLDKDLMKKIDSLKKSGLTDIKIRTTFDEQGLKRFTATGKDAFGNVTKEAGKYNRKLDGTIDTTTTLTEVTNKSGKSLNFIAKGFISAAQTAVKYALGLGLIYKAMGQLNDGVQFIKDLDKEMRNIQIVAGYSDAQIRDMAVSYSELGKEMGATTLEIASGSLEWIRQGKTIDETNELLQSTLMLSKLGNVEAAESTEYLTSVLNGFKLEADDSVSVVDKLVAVDNAAATSVKELATALQAGSVSAQKAGVDLDELIAYVGTVSSVTRQNAARIGTAFRTMFARFQDIKHGAIDDTGMSLNNVEAALNRVTSASGENMSIVNRQTGEFRDFSDVLKDLYAVWDDLTEIEQANISKAMAGVRQREIFLTLMENEKMMLDLLSESRDSSGLAAERYAIFLEGLEAAQNKAKASWESLWMATLEGDLVKTFYDAQSSVFEFGESLGGLDEVLKVIIVSLGTYLSISGLATISTFSFAGAIETLAIAMMLNPVTAVAGALAGLAGALTLASNESKKLSQDISDLWTISMRDAKEETSDATEVVHEFKKALEEANEAYEKSPWYQKLFFDKQTVARSGIDEFGSLLESRAKTLDEYNQGILDMAEASGYAQDAEGRFSRVATKGSAVYLEYNDSLKLLNDEQWRFIQLSKAVDEGWIDSGYKDVSSEVEDGKESADNFSIAVKELTSNTMDASSAWEKFFKTISDGDTSTLDKVESLQDFLNSMSGAGILVPDMSDLFTDGLLDIAKVTDFYKDAINSLRAEFEGLSAEQQSEASYLIAVYDEMLYSLESRVIEGVSITNSQIKNMSADLGSVIYGNGQVVLSALDGTVLTSADMVTAAIISDFRNYTYLVSQLKAAGIKDFNDIMGYIRNRAAFEVGATPYMPTMPTFSGGGSTGGGGSRKESAEKRRIDSETKALNERKKALQDELKEFKKSIDAQKEALKIKKEEAEFLDSLADKNKDLSKLKADIALLELDDSEEAKARRLKLEEEAAELEKEISEDKEDRKYELQIQALDDFQDAYEESIQKQISAIESQIDRLKDEKDALDDVASSAGSAGGAFSAMGQQGEIASNKIIDGLDMIGYASDEQKAKIQSLIDELVQAGYAAEEVARRAQAALYSMLNVITLANGRQVRVNFDTTSKDIREDGYVIKHDGGLVESHHSGDFAGGLKSNEVFAKLLKGEYVATESQMENFLTKTLPSLFSAAPSHVANNDNGLSISMPINIEGNVNDDTLPKIEKITRDVIREINKTMRSRGNLRDAKSFSV